MQPLISFNASYYAYPKSICRGYWGRYALDIDLSADDRKRRSEWLANVRRLSETPFHDHVFSRYGQGTDDSFFMDILRDHGLFVEKFFHLSGLNATLNLASARFVAHSIVLSIFQTGYMQARMVRICVVCSVALSRGLQRTLYFLISVSL